ncbi:Protein NETWORKED 2D [Camellia lanceoleosa]|uniref:Protein NETWORKED 2D n=1 Tax=Camellia lanceoleosa TaxID=1840588 RepID=A0ACC0I0W2_9ERIC|nr:Protein NETWORKED 2D [Camellia lanceoleosa]
MPRPKDGSINSGELKAAVRDDKNGQVGYIDFGELKAAVGDDKSGQQSISPIEEKLRTNIDALLDENLDFWLRFSTSFHQIQKFKTGFQDLQAKISKFKEKEKSSQEGNVNATTNIKSDLWPIYKHLREIRTELTLWIEQSISLKDELQREFSSLCNIQEEITNALTKGTKEEEMLFTSHDAAQFQGEDVNMKQKNNKVRDELQTGLDHVTTLQHKIKKTLAKLDKKFDISGSKNNNQPQLRHSTSRTQVPLRSFIFGTKPKKMTSIFACMHHRKYHDLRAGLSL